MATFRVTTEFVVRDEREFYDKDSPLSAARSAYNVLEADEGDIWLDSNDIYRFIVVELDENGHEKQRTKTVFSQNFVEIPF